jgi:hypothetical protein
MMDITEHFLISNGERLKVKVKVEAEEKDESSECVVFAPKTRIFCVMLYRKRRLFFYNYSWGFDEECDVWKFLDL